MSLHPAAVAALAGTLAAAVLIPTPSRAGGLPEHHRPGVESCYRLEPGARPKGRVVGITLFRDLKGDPQREDTLFAGDRLKTIEAENGSATVTAYFRLSTAPSVVHAQRLHCADTDTGAACNLDCDGGGFRLAPRGEGLTLTSPDQGLTLVGGCGAPEGSKPVVLQQKDLAGPFALARAPADECRAERDAWRPAYAASVPPIRETFTAGTECFARGYDKAHLAARPAQTVASITLRRLPVEGKIDPEQFDLALTVTQKSGKTVARTGRCSAEDYAFSCIVDGSESEEDAFLVTRAPGRRIAIRDEHKVLPRLLGLKLGADDRTFVLDEADEKACGR